MILIRFRQQTLPSGTRMSGSLANASFTIHSSLFTGIVHFIGVMKIIKKYLPDIAEFVFTDQSENRVYSSTGVNIASL